MLTEASQWVSLLINICVGFIGKGPDTREGALKMPWEGFSAFGTHAEAFSLCNYDFANKTMHDLFNAPSITCGSMHRFPNCNFCFVLFRIQPFVTSELQFTIYAFCDYWGALKQAIDSVNLCKDTLVHALQNQWESHRIGLQSDSQSLAVFKEFLCRLLEARSKEKRA